MKRKALVAGAGHGGLAAAILLSRGGWDVTVFERQAREAIGYDWPDCFVPAAMARAGLEPPPPAQLRAMGSLCYLNPAKTVLLRPETLTKSKTVFYVERKDLLRHLCALAEESGVRLVFEETVLGAVTQGERVTGLRTQSGAFACDLVIDAAGMHSPVRQSLPAACGIRREIRREDTLVTYRAIYEKTDAEESLPPACAYFFHCGTRGFDWVLREEDGVDVLVGAFGDLSEAALSAALADFRADHPALSDRLLRGGQIAEIPVRPALPQFVCSGYAAVGDSASMIEPLSGSGITQSIEAGAMLAETALAAADAPLTVERLWQFEAAYVQRYAARQLKDDASKAFMMRAGKTRLDILFEKQFLAEKEFYGGRQTGADLRAKVRAVLTSPSLLPLLGYMLLRTWRNAALLRTFPAQYDAKRIAAWKRRYERTIKTQSA